MKAGARVLCIAGAALIAGCSAESPSVEEVFGQQAGGPASGPTSGPNAVAAACAPTRTVATPTAPPPGTPPGSLDLDLEQIIDDDDDELNTPVFVTAPPGDIARVFVVERGGLIKIVDLAENEVVDGPPFLNISSLVSSGGEAGLLGLAFDPGYALNRRFYVSYVNDDGDTVVARYLRSLLNPNAAVPTADRIIITVPASGANFGGTIAFGPGGFLYIGRGDGGGAGDPNNVSQDLGDLRGKILRIDVSGGVAPAPPYTIPLDNPCVGQPGARGEIWSMGLRDPRRFSFDRDNGNLYIGDGGQTRDEISISPASAGAGNGANFGWRIMQGKQCFNPAPDCNTENITQPALDFARAAGTCAVTGGYVYRGINLPDLAGTYFYADSCADAVRSFRFVNGQVTQHFTWPELDPPGTITSFGEDALGELYITTAEGGLFRVTQ